MKSITLQCKKEDAQLVSNPDGDLRQTRFVHLGRKYFLRALQRIGKFGPTTVGVSQGKGGKECAPSGRPCVRPVVLEGVNGKEERVGGEGGCIYVTMKIRSIQRRMVSIRQRWATGDRQAQGLPYSGWTSALAQPSFSVGPRNNPGSCLVHIPDNTVHSSQRGTPWPRQFVGRAVWTDGGVLLGISVTRYRVTRH